MSSRKSPPASYAHPDGTMKIASKNRMKISLGISCFKEELFEGGFYYNGRWYDHSYTPNTKLLLNKSNTFSSELAL